MASKRSHRTGRRRAIIAATMNKAPLEQSDFLAWWTLNETGSPATWEDSRGTNHLTKTDTVTSKAEGLQAGAADFATDGWLSAGSVPGTLTEGPFSVGGWFQVADLVKGYFLSQYGPTEQKWLLWQAGSDDKIKFRIKNAAGTSFDVVSDGTYTTLNQWVFVVATFDGTTSRLWINGVLQAGSATVTGAPHTAAQPFWIGRQNSAFLTGSADEVFISTKTLALNEVAWLYNGGGGRTWEDILEPSALALPEGENIVFDMDISTGAAWATTGSASVTNEGDHLLFEATTGDARLFPSLIPSGDFITYLHLASDQAPGSYSHFEIGNAPSDRRITISLGYNWATGSGATDRLSFMTVASAVNQTRAGVTVDIAAGVEIAVHWDSIVGQVSVFYKSAGKWLYVDSAPCDDPYEDEIRLSRNTGGSMKIYYASFCKPLFASIGDSICAGHNNYDPDPDYYAGVDDYASSWQAHISIPTKRNSLIVNYGIGSQSSATIDSRVAGMLTNTEAKAVFLHASTGDYTFGVSQNDRTINIQTSVDRIVAAGAKAVLLNAIASNSNHTLAPDHGQFLKDWWSTRLNEITGTDAKVDIMRGIAAGDGFIDPAYEPGDGVHPTAEGYALIAAEVAKVLT